MAGPKEETACGDVRGRCSGIEWKGSHAEGETRKFSVYVFRFRAGWKEHGDMGWEPWIPCSCMRKCSYVSLKPITWARIRDWSSVSLNFIKGSWDQILFIKRQTMMYGYMPVVCTQCVISGKESMNGSLQRQKKRDTWVPKHIRTHRTKSILEYIEESPMKLKSTLGIL